MKYETQILNNLEPPAWKFTEVLNSSKMFTQFHPWQKSRISHVFDP